MKKMGLGLGLVAAVVLSASATVAKADSVVLGNIDTNNCARAQSEVDLLNSRAVRVQTACQAGAFAGKNGEVYRYRLRTAAEVARNVRVGDRIRMANIDTDNCDAARSEIALLKSSAVSVAATCEAGEFRGKNGRFYNYRLHTTITVRASEAIRDQYDPRDEYSYDDSL
jgi:hypothetical protein